MQAIPRLGAAAKELYVFQRTPSSIDIRDDWPTDPEWARKLQPGLAGEAALKRARLEPQMTEEQKARAARDVARGEDPPAGERQHRIR